MSSALEIETQTEITLIDLPGSGKETVKKALLNALNNPKNPKIARGGVKVSTFSLVLSPFSVKNSTVWLVIDVRSSLDHQQALTLINTVAKKTALIVFCYTEQSDLETQAFWLNWAKKQAPNTGVSRIFYDNFPKDFNPYSFLQSASQVCFNEITSSKTLQKLSFPIKVVNLEHLMSGLDACKQNLAMDIWRVKGSFMTVEYKNPVALEGTVNRWDTFAAEISSNRLEIMGYNLDEQFIAQIITASEAFE